VQLARTLKPDIVFRGVPVPWWAGGSANIPPRTFVAERYARGEISVEEYRGRLGGLKGGRRDRAFSKEEEGGS